MDFINIDFYYFKVIDNILQQTVLQLVSINLKILKGRGLNEDGAHYFPNTHDAALISLTVF